MYELVKAGAVSFYIDCPAKIGVIDNGDGSVCLIDSGSDKDAGRRIRRILENNSWSLKAILNTHSHADHTGGNAYLQKQTGCRIFCPEIEADFARHPVLEPSLLVGGFPVSALKNKFLMAQESAAEEISSPDFPNDITPIPLPGHFFNMHGYRAPDGTVFLADCLSSAHTLDKYGIPFIYDIRSYYETLDIVEKLDAPMFIPSHADMTDNIAPLVQVNRQKLNESVDTILKIISSPICFDEIIKSVFDFYGLSLTLQQYALVGSTVCSVLSWLADTDKAGYIIENNMLLWERK